MPQAAKRPSHARKKKRAAPYRAPAAADDTAGQPAGAAKTAAKAAQKNALASNPKTSTEYVVRDAQWVAQPSTSGTRQGTAFRQPSSARAGKPSDDVRRRAAAKAMAPVDGKTALPNQGKRASGERSSSSRDAAASLATDSKRVRPALQNAGRAVAEVTAARKDEDAAKAQLDAHNNRAITRRAALDTSHSLRDERERLEAEPAARRNLREEKEGDIMHMLESPLEAFDQDALWQLVMHEFAMDCHDETLMARWATASERSPRRYATKMSYLVSVACMSSMHCMTPT